MIMQILPTREEGSTNDKVSAYIGSVPVIFQAIISVWGWQITKAINRLKETSDE